MMDAPGIVKPIPPQVINERAAFGPFPIKDFFQGEQLRFQAELTDGKALPQGMICTADGFLTGIPAKQTEGFYEIKVTAQNEAGTVDSEFRLTIKPSLLQSPENYAEKLKAQVWAALEQRLPVPDLGDLSNQPITLAEIYHLLERWALLKIWDAFNLEPPGPLVPLELEGASPHYHVYDRGSCLVAAPKDLFSAERTLEDSLQTARAMTREVYSRGWTIELVGFEKMVRAAWVETQHLSDKYGKSMDVLNYSPSPADIKIYSVEAIHARRQRLESKG